MARVVPAIVETSPVACELMDRSLIHLAVDQLPQYRDILPAGAAAVLLIEHVGASAAEVREKIEATDLAVGKAATGRTIITDPKAQARVWKSRKDAGPLLYRKRSRKHPAEFMEDVSVDFRRLADYIAGLEKIQKKHEIAMSFFGHAGDGELHLRPYLDLGDPGDRDKMKAIAEEVFTLAWSLGGSISGEHAVGLIRAAYVRRQYGDEYYDILKKVKAIFDPAGLMNPGKILNEDPDVMFKSLRRERHILSERAKSEMLFKAGELELELEQCYGCGLCLGREPALRMCPVFRATGEELGSSRAKANLLHYWATGQLDEKDFESPEFRKFLDLCVNCKMCERQCPSGTNISMLMAAARAEYVRRKGLRRTEFVLSRNRHLSRMGSLFAPLSNVAMSLPVVQVAAGEGHRDRQAAEHASLQPGLVPEGRLQVPGGMWTDCRSGGQGGVLRRYLCQLQRPRAGFCRRGCSPSQRGRGYPAGPASVAAAGHCLRGCPAGQTRSVLQRQVPRPSRSRRL